MNKLCRFNIQREFKHSKTIDINLSRNFAVLKLASIMIVFIGHFFKGTFELIWVPTTVALLVFSYSSGFFTEVKYGRSLNISTFYFNKIKRLGLSLTVIEIFLFGLFIFERRQGIYTWQTIINLFGLNGLLNWFNIPNPSPYGRATWFLTLLILFYICYPALQFLTDRMLLIFTLGFSIICFFLNLYIDVGHALWLTACGFIYGVLVARCNVKIPYRYSIILCIFSFLLMLSFNFQFNINQLNFILILSFSVLFVFSIQSLTIGSHIYGIFSIFTGCILEIYLLHPYLSVHPTNNLILDFIISVIIVFVSAKFLNNLTNCIQHYLLDETK